jgi:RNA polymerase sigma-70 factor, ECF subfamily
MCYQSDLADIQPELFAFVKSRVKNKEDANDIVQETNQVIINKENQYDTARPFKGWAFGIARWQVLAYFKRLKRSAPVQSLDATDASSNFLGLNPNWLSDVPFAHLIRKERKALIRSLDQILSRRQKEVFNLLVDGLNHQEIASIIGTSRVNVQVLQSRLIQKIRNFVTKNNNNKYHHYLR